MKLLAIFILNLLVSLAYSYDSNGINLENLKVDVVLKDWRGNYIFYFDAYEVDDKRIKYDDIFFGTKKGLYQLAEARSSSLSSGSEGLIEVDTGFYAEIDGQEIEDTSINYNYDSELRRKLNIRKDRPFIACGDKVKKLRKANSKKAQRLLRKIKSGKIPLHLFPKVRKPISLIRTKDNQSPAYYYYAEMDKYRPDGIRVFSGIEGKLLERPSYSAFTSCHTHPKDKAHLHSSLFIEVPESDEQIVIPGWSFGKDNNYTPFTWKRSGEWNDQILENVALTKENLEKLGIPGIPAEDIKLKTPCDQFFNL